MLRLLLTRRWLLRLLVLAAAVAAFLTLGWWQWLRAGEGNARSFGYAVEWPLFAAFAVWWYWRMLALEAHPPPERPPIEPSREQRTAARTGGSPDNERDGEPDDELVAYNRYLAWLHEQDQRHAR